MKVDLQIKNKVKCNEVDIVRFLPGRIVLTGNETGAEKLSVDVSCGVI